mmetsp:Transcript_74744/g.214076  ORF Transcript_74744/g.214076 Transcript_74744/m.214076 type:complete len:326 (+) Transcript_74744:779-1756(+)
MALLVIIVTFASVARVGLAVVQVLRGIGLEAPLLRHALELVARIQGKGHEAGHKLLEADIAAVVRVRRLEHLRLSVSAHVFIHVLKDHPELFEIDLIVPVHVVVAEERGQDLAHPADLVHGLLVQQDLVQIAVLAQRRPISLPELGHRASEGELAVPHGLHRLLSDPVVNPAVLAIGVPPTNLQVVRELDHAHKEPDQCKGSFRPGLHALLRDPRRLLEGVHGEGGAQDDEVPHGRTHHHLGRSLDSLVVANTSPQQAPLALGVELLPSLGIRARWSLVSRRSVLQRHAAKKHSEEPRQCEQHDGATCQGADAYGHLVLSIGAQA